MATINTQELTGAALDLAVALADPQCDGLKYKLINGVMCGVDTEDEAICIFFTSLGDSFFKTVRAKKSLGVAGEHAELYSPSSDWKKAGRLIQQENIGISPPTSRVHRNGGPNGGWGESGVWTATTWHKGVNGRRAIAWHEDQPLVAAMRCYVASKLGDSIDVPEMPAQRAQAQERQQQ